MKKVGQFLIAFALINLIIVSFCYAGWLSPEWRNRKAVEVSNLENDTALIDYAVKLDVAGNKQFKSDFSDLRFTTANGEDELNYWIEDFIPGIYATVWVKVPCISAHSFTEIYMYYGNLKAASKSSGEETFLFYDDFDDCNIDDWSIVWGTWFANNAFLEQSEYAIRRKILSSFSFNRPIIVRTKLNHFTGDPVCGLHIMFSKDTYCENGYYFGYAGINRGGTMISRITNGNVVQLVTDSTIQNSMYPNQWLDITVYFKGNGIYNLFLEAPDGKKVALELHDNTFQKPYTLGLWVGDHIGCDDIVVNKYTGHPPKVSFGGEEKNPWYSPLSADISSDKIFSITNPLRANRKVDFSVSFSGLVNVSLYDLSGRLVSNPLHNIYLEKGIYSLIIGARLKGKTGIYFLKFDEKGKLESISKTRKVVLIR